MRLRFVSVQQVPRIYQAIVLHTEKKKENKTNSREAALRTSRESTQVNKMTSGREWLRLKALVTTDGIPCPKRQILMNLATTTCGEDLGSLRQLPTQWGIVSDQALRSVSQQWFFGWISHA